jgi:DNA-repair protein XRCC3
MATTPLPPEESLLGQRTQKLTLGCPVLDKLCGGGIPVASLTELVGESTVGKTQLCLQLLLTAQLHPHAGGLGGRAVYIHTEGRAALQRLAELASTTPGLGTDPCDWVLVANATAGPDHLLEAVRQARGRGRKSGANWQLARRARVSKRGCGC